MLKIDETVVPLLKDFEIFTYYLEENRIKLTSGRGWIPSEILYELNSKMSYSTPQTTPRTSQKFYVLLNLLYYLATEGRLFNKVREKRTLYLEPTERLELYRELTLTEKYFFLLETLWRDIDWRFLDIDRFSREDPIFGMPQIFSSLLPWKVYSERFKRSYLSWHDFRMNYIVFILYLYRLIDIYLVFDAENYIPYFKYYIPIEKIKMSSLGEFLLPILAEKRDIFHWNLPWRIRELGEANPIPGSPFQEEIGKKSIKKPYIEEPFFLPFVHLFEKGELTKTLPRIVNRVDFIDGVYTFKVSLLPERDIWRRIKISADHTLFDLAEAILDAYKFDRSHLFSFFMDGKKWSPYEFTSPYDNEGPYSTEVRIGELNLCLGQKFLYLYDYGAQWEFEVKLESIDQNKPKPDTPKIIEKHGRSPEQYPVW